MLFFLTLRYVCPAQACKATPCLLLWETAEAKAQEQKRAWELAVAPRGKDHHFIRSDTPGCIKVRVVRIICESHETEPRCLAALQSFIRGLKCKARIWCGAAAGSSLFPSDIRQQTSSVTVVQDMLGLRVSGIVLSKNWEESLFQEDTDANVIMLSNP